MSKKNPQGLLWTLVMVASSLISLDSVFSLSTVAQDASFETQSLAQWWFFGFTLLAIACLLWYEHGQRSRYPRQAPRDSQRLEKLLDMIHHQTRMTIRHYERKEKYEQQTDQP